MKIKRVALIILIGAFSLLPCRSMAVALFGQTIPPLIEEAFQTAHQLEAQRRFSDAYQVYARLLKNTELPPAVEAQIWFRWGRAQQQNHERSKALQSTLKAIELDPSSEDIKAFLSQLKGVPFKRSSDAISMFYAAWRGFGSARELTRSNGVLHIFVRGRNSRPWTRRERLIAEAQVVEASHWLLQKSVSYQVQDNPKFEHRYLILNDELYWNKLKIPDSTTPNPDLRRWIEGIPSRFGARTMDDLFVKTFTGTSFDNRAIVFHSIKEGRAFAMPANCNGLSDKALESAFLHLDDRELYTSAHAEVYAHELLHLYGADDLYNKVADPAIPDRDIMKCTVSDLSHAILGSLTAYAIGWLANPPHLTQLRLDSPERL